MAVIYTKKQKRSIVVRVCLLVALLVIIVVCVVNVLNSIKTKDGYSKITADFSNISEASGDYSLYYYTDSSNGNSVAYNQNELKKLYSDLIDKSYSLLSSSNEYDDIKNIYYINNHPNEIISIDSFLYDSLKLIDSYDSRFLLMGGINQLYTSIMFNDLIDKSNYDPINNEDNRNFITSFLSSYNSSISVEFFESNSIRLNVSDLYIKRDNEGYTEYISTSIFFDSLIMDYIKDEFNKLGYYNGYISSNSGLLLDFGTKAELLQSFNLLCYRFEQIAKFGTINISKNYAYVNLYEFNVNPNYGFYSFTKDGTLYKRDSYISLDTLESNSDNISYLVYDDTSLSNAVYKMYLLKNENIKDVSYFILDDLYKCHTNIKNLEVGSFVEVVYE